MRRQRLIKICQYIYELANAFNSFYHDTKILAEEDEARKESYIGLISLTRRVLEACIGLLGIEAPGACNRGDVLDADTSCLGAGVLGIPLKGCMKQMKIVRMNTSSFWKGRLV